MRINYNVSAMIANNSLKNNDDLLSASLQRLSSGFKINGAKDNPAGLAMAKRMNAQITGTKTADDNTMDGISVIETADGALSEVTDMLQRMNELAVQASNGTMSESDRSYVQNEIDQLVTEIDRVAETTKFNETYLLKGSGEASAQVKAEATIGDTTSAATVKTATGNIYAGKVESTLASGTEETATITYKDAEGNSRSKDVTFKIGADSKATAANFAKAIGRRVKNVAACSIFLLERYFRSIL